MTQPLFRLLTLLGLVLAFGSTWADQLTGRVVGIADGDTLTVLTAKRQQHRVRLSGIDAPEKHQAFGQVSKQHLSDLVYRQTVGVGDRYKRILGKVLVNGADAGLNQIQSGLAWHYKRYEREQSAEDRIAYGKGRGEGSDRAARSLARPKPGAALEFPQALTDVCGRSP